MQTQDIFYCDAVMVANMLGPDELVVCVVSDSLFLSCFACLLASSELLVACKCCKAGSPCIMVR